MCAVLDLPSADLPVRHAIDPHVRSRCIERQVIDKAKPLDHTRGAVVSFIIGDLPGVLRRLHLLEQLGVIAFFDFRLMPHLRQLGHDVLAISQNYPPGLADEDVLAIAREEERLLVVADRDFGELIFHQGLCHVGVIFFRLPGASLQTKIEHLNTVIEEHAEELARGEFLVVSPGQIRVADRPRS